MDGWQFHSSLSSFLLRMGHHQKPQTSLVVQWLSLTAPKQGDWVPSLVMELTPRPTARSSSAHMPSGRLKIPCAAAETQCSQRQEPRPLSGC